MKKKDELKIVPYSLKKDGITSSMFGTAFNCRKKFLFWMNRYSSSRDSLAIYFGNLVHHTLDKIYSKDYTSKIKKRGLDGTVRGIMKMIPKYLDKYEASDNDKISTLDPQQVVDTRYKAEIMLIEYVKFWKKDFKEFGTTLPEKEFEITIENGYKIRGKIDMLFGKKNIILFETKTKGRIPSDLERYIKDNNQVQFYLKAVDEMIKRGDFKEIKNWKKVKEVNEVVYNLIRNSNHKRNKNETKEEFFDRLRQIVQKTPEHFFIRYHINITKKDKDRFRKTLKIKLNELNTVIKSKDLDSYYTNETACYSPFKCDFYDACFHESFVGLKKRSKLFTELNFEDKKKKGAK